MMKGVDKLEPSEKVKDNWLLSYVTRVTCGASFPGDPSWPFGPTIESPFSPFSPLGPVTESPFEPFKLCNHSVSVPLKPFFTATW